MALVKMDPLRIEWPDLFGRAFEERFWPELFGTAEGTLRVEEFTEGDSYVVRAEMPGIDPDKDVEITVSDSMLHIHAERHEEIRTEDRDGYRSEFRYGAFVRSLALPMTATEKDVKATYSDGILEVRVPLATKPKTETKVKVARG